MASSSCPSSKRLCATYGKRADTFLSSAGELHVFGVNAHYSAKLVSDLLGQETVVSQTLSRELDSDPPGVTLADYRTGWPQLTPAEVRKLPSYREILFLAGLRPIVADKLCYFADRECAGRFQPIRLYR